MKYHRYGCYGWLGWPKYAHAYSFSDANTPETVQESRSHFGSHRSSSFGARRPLRYLSYQLDLDDSQRRKLAASLDRLKVAREQAALDEKKALANVADVLSTADANATTIRSALSHRVESTEQLQTTVAAALAEIVSMLDPDQREEFVYLLRTGAFRI